MPRMSLIDRKHHRFVFAFFMALLMSCIMSLVITLFNVGLVPDLALRWLKAWGFAFAVAFPTVTFVAPLVHRLVAIVLKEGPRDA